MRPPAPTRLRNAAAAPIFCSALTLMMRGVLAYPGCVEEAVTRARAGGGADPLLASASFCMEPSPLRLAEVPCVASSSLPLIEASEVATDAITLRVGDAFKRRGALTRCRKL